MMKIDLCPIKGGEFRMGADVETIDRQLDQFRYAFSDLDPAEARRWFLKQVPPRRVTLSTYDISYALISRGQFAQFEEAVFGARSEMCDGDPELPVEGVPFYRARQFCDWLSLDIGRRVSLPSEAEWEYAASSRGRYLFPWGDTFDPSRANTAEAGLGQSSKPGTFLAGRSEQGVVDLAGNLEEWTDSFYLPYPGGTFVHDDIARQHGNAYPVLRGGCYRHHADLCLAARRHGFRENYTPVGFRIVVRPD